MAKKSITKNYIYNLIYQVLVLILPLVTTPYISRVLGAENIGIYSYTLSIVTYFILFGSLGVALYGQREIAYYQKDKKKYSIIFWEIVILRSITMTISLILFYIIFVNGNQYQIYYKILILELIGNCIDISWFFQGLEEFKKTVTRNMISPVLKLTEFFSEVFSLSSIFRLIKRPPFYKLLSIKGFEDYYFCHIAVEPHGKTIPLDSTGSPISSKDTFPPNFSVRSEPKIYPITDGESPVV